MNLARGPCHHNVSILFFLCRCLSHWFLLFLTRSTSSLALSYPPLFHLLRAPTLSQSLPTYLVPLSHSVMVLVKSLPVRHVVLAEEARELGHTVAQLSEFGSPPGRYGSSENLRRCSGECRPHFGGRMGCLGRSWGVQCVSCRCQGAVSSVGKPQPVTGNGIVRSKAWH